MKSLFKALGAGVLSALMSQAAMGQEDRMQQDLAKVPKAEALSRYAQWVQLAGSGCCSSPDANIGLKQRLTGDPAYPLEIEFTRTVDGTSPLSHPKWIKFEASKVKDQKGKDIDQQCATQRKVDETQGKASTCVHPPGAFAFGFDNRTSNQQNGTFTLSGHPEKVYKPGDIVNADDWELITKYCVYPTKLQM